MTQSFLENIRNEFEILIKKCPQMTPKDLWPKYFPTGMMEIRWDEDMRGVENRYNYIIFHLYDELKQKQNNYLSDVIGAEKMLWLRESRNQRAHPGEMMEKIRQQKYHFSSCCNLWEIIKILESNVK